jgi:hypothetical protein
MTLPSGPVVLSHGGKKVIHEGSGTLRELYLSMLRQIEASYHTLPLNSEGRVEPFFKVDCFNEQSLLMAMAMTPEQKIQSFWSTTPKKLSAKGRIRLVRTCDFYRSFEVSLFPKETITSATLYGTLEMANVAPIYVPIVTIDRPDQKFSFFRDEATPLPIPIVVFPYFSLSLSVEIDSPYDPNGSLTDRMIKCEMGSAVLAVRNKIMSNSSSHVNREATESRDVISIMKRWASSFGRSYSPHPSSAIDRTARASEQSSSICFFCKAEQKCMITCDNDCGTMLCSTCGTEPRLRPKDAREVKGHHPKCGLEEE